MFGESECGSFPATIETIFAKCEDWFGGALNPGCNLTRSFLTVQTRSNELQQSVCRCRWGRRGCDQPGLARSHVCFLQSCPPGSTLRGRLSGPISGNLRGRRSLTARRGGLRTVRIAALRGDGRHVDFEKSVPALPTFEEAFSAFARGTLLQTICGEVAIEDLVPGDTLRTMGGREARIEWIGKAIFDRRAGEKNCTLVRIVPDSFGEGRPTACLTLGSGARILQTPPHLRAHAAHMGLLTPASAFVDAVNVVEIAPPAPVELFHVMLDRHAVVQAGGLDCETYHPGPDIAHRLNDEQRALFMSLFPAIPDMAGFGPLIYPRAPGVAE